MRLNLRARTHSGEFEVARRKHINNVNIVYQSVRSFYRPMQRMQWCVCSCDNISELCVVWDVKHFAE